MSYDLKQDKIMYILGMCILAGFVVAGIIFYANEDFLRAVMPPCVFHSITGYYCPGCGCTRAVYAMLGGHLITAFIYNAFIPYIMIFGGWFLLSQTLQRLSRNKLAIGMHFRPIYAYLAIGILLLNCIVKNIVLATSGIALI